MKVSLVFALGLLVAVCTGAIAADPDLVGAWTGERERIAANEDAYTKGPMTLVITGQEGRTFTGHLSRTYADKDAIDEGLWGAFTPDGNLMVGADEEGTYAFKLVDADTLDYCYSEAGATARAVCARLTRKK
jgi:hypothetical protein